MALERWGGKTKSVVVEVVLLVCIILNFMFGMPNVSSVERDILLPSDSITGGR